MTIKILAISIMLITSALFADPQKECELAGRLISSSRKFSRLAETKVNDYFAKQYAIEYGYLLEDYATCMWYACAAVCKKSEANRVKMCSEDFYAAYHKFFPYVEMNVTYYHDQEVHAAYDRSRTALRELY